MRAHRPGDILMIEPNEEFSNLIALVLRDLGHTVKTCQSSETALKILQNEVFDVVLCEHILPGQSGAALCRLIKADDRFGSPLFALIIDPSIFDSDAADVLGLHQTLDAQKSDFLRPDDVILVPLPPEMLAARLLSLLRMRRYLEESRNAVGALMQTAEGIEEQDSRSLGHCKRLATMSIELGAVLGCDEWELTSLERAGYLHDIGMVTIHGALTHKIGTLLVGEMEALKMHTIAGEDLCRPVAALKPVLPVIRSHHERADGTGYPDKLKGDEIPYLAQIFAIPHLYEAMRLSRPHRSAMTEGQAIMTMEEEARNGFWNTTILKEFVENVLPGLEERLTSMDILWPQ